jgi:hypothetical protein
MGFNRGRAHELLQIVDDSYPKTANLKLAMRNRLFFGTVQDVCERGVEGAVRKRGNYKHWIP